MSDTAGAPAAEAGDARLFTLICYGLFLAALATGFTAIVGVVLAYIKRAESRGTIWESHFTSLIWLFWVGIAVFIAWVALIIGGVVGLLSNVDHDTLPPLAGLLPAAWLLSFVYLVWYVYRTVRGLLRALDGMPYR